MCVIRAARIAAISSLFGLFLPAAALANARYDGDIEDRFLLNLGIYEQTDHRTQINLESTDLAIGVVFDLEDELNVEEDTGAVFRLDGHYRFNRAHRIEWTWYSTERTGRVEIFDESIDIGDLELRFGANVESAIEYGVLKLGYAWSFVNNQFWELSLGAGANFYRDRVRFTTRLFSGLESEHREYEEKGKGPLPTAAFGVRYKPGLWVWYWDYEVVSTEVGDFSGRLRESVIGIEHNTWPHAGFGLGLINSGDFVETEDDGAEGEFDSEYEGWRLYLKTWF